jgi:hypothetical protein
LRLYHRPQVCCTTLEINFETGLWNASFLSKLWNLQHYLLAWKTFFFLWSPSTKT